jgi:hypothetical protein
MQPTAHPATHAHPEFAPLNNYLASIESQFPHDLFQATEHRSSKISCRDPPTGDEKGKSRDTARGSGAADGTQ